MMKTAVFPGRTKFFYPVLFLIVPTFVATIFLPGVLRAEDKRIPWQNKLFDSMEHDFGTVAHGTKAVHFFVMENPYAEDVHISNVYSSCTCTTPYIQKKTLRTYEKAILLAQFNADVNTFSKSATITVEFDKPERATAVLQVKGYIRPDITFTPDSVRFDVLKEGIASTRTVNLRYSGPNSAWRLIEASSPVGFLDAKVVSNELSGGNILSKIEVTVKPDAPKGKFSERVMLISNENARDRRSQIPLLVEGTVPGGISVTPPVLFLGFLKPGETVVKDVQISSDKPFLVTSATSEEPAVSITLEHLTKPMRHQLLPVRIEVPEDITDAKYQVLIKVETDKPDLKTSFYAMAEVRGDQTTAPSAKDEASKENREGSKE